MKDMRTVAMSASVAPLVALAILAMSGSLEPLVAQSIPVSPIVGLNTLNWSASAGFGSTAPGWYKEVGLVDPDVVHLQGAVKQTSASGSDAKQTFSSASNLLGTIVSGGAPQNRIIRTIVHTFDGSTPMSLSTPTDRSALTI